MLLRVNSQVSGDDTDLDAIVDTDVDSGIPNGSLLSQLVDTTLRPEEHEAEAGSQVRQDICDAMGADALVDASAIIGNFQRMVRIADGTGIPLDKPVAVMSAEIRESLGINRFGSAGLTPKVGIVQKWLGRVMGPMMINRMSKQMADAPQSGPKD